MHMNAPRSPVSTSTVQQGISPAIIIIGIGCKFLHRGSLATLKGSRYRSDKTLQNCLEQSRCQLYVQCTSKKKLKQAYVAYV